MLIVACCGILVLVCRDCRKGGAFSCDLDACILEDSYIEGIVKAYGLAVDI